MVVGRGLQNTYMLYLTRFASHAHNHLNHIEKRLNTSFLTAPYHTLSLVRIHEIFAVCWCVCVYTLPHSYFGQDTRDLCSMLVCVCSYLTRLFLWSGYTRSLCVCVYTLPDSFFGQDTRDLCVCVYTLPDSFFGQDTRDLCVCVFIPYQTLSLVRIHEIFVCVCLYLTRLFLWSGYTRSLCVCVYTLPDSFFGQDTRDLCVCVYTLPDSFFGQDTRDLCVCVFTTTCRKKIERTKTQKLNLRLKMAWPDGGVPTGSAKPVSLVLKDHSTSFSLSVSGGSPVRMFG